MMRIPEMPSEHPPAADVVSEILITLQWFFAIAALITLIYFMIKFHKNGPAAGIKTGAPPEPKAPPLDYKAELWHTWRALPVEDREWFEGLHPDVWKPPAPVRLMSLQGKTTNSLLPEGYYEAQILKASTAKTKNKTPYIKLEIETLDGHKLIHNLYRPTDPDRRKFYYHQLEILDIGFVNRDTDMELLADWLLVPGPIPVRIKIKHETYNYETHAISYLVRQVDNVPTSILE